MSGIAGFCDYRDNLREEAPLWGALAKRMGGQLRRRGPGGWETFVTTHAAFAHTRTVRDAPQPLSRIEDGFCYTLVFDGELCNGEELRRELKPLGCRFETDSDAEVLLCCYIRFGPFCAEKLCGSFAFAVDDERRKCTYLCRDRFGVKPLFYTVTGGRLVFGSEMKSIFEYPGVCPTVGREGLCELFGLGPSRTAGCGVFKGISELKPGHAATFSREGFRSYSYFELESRIHTDSYQDTLAKVQELTKSAIEKRMDSEPKSAFLPSSLLPQYDGETIADTLYDAVVAKDLPSMADADASLLHFCSRLKHPRSHILSAEGAEEIFGCNPWFSKDPGGLCFPWSPDLKLRAALLRPEISQAVRLEDYVSQRYEEAVASAPRLSGEPPESRRFRELSWLTLSWYLPTLLERLDRTAMYSGLELGLPFTDHRLVQYLFNVPQEFKLPASGESLLESVRGLLPMALPQSNQSSVYSEDYGLLIAERLNRILADPEEPIHQLVDLAAVESLLSPPDSGRIWFGPLKARPQLCAWLLQLNFWLKRYDVGILL